VWQKKKTKKVILIIDSFLAANQITIVSYIRLFLEIRSSENLSFNGTNQTRYVDALNADRLAQPCSSCRRKKCSPVENVNSSLEFKLLRVPQALLGSLQVLVLVTAAERFTVTVLNLNITSAATTATLPARNAQGHCIKRSTTNSVYITIIVCFIFWILE